MKKHVFFLALAGAFALVACSEQQHQGGLNQAEKQAAEITLDTHEKRLSYATAYDFHKQKVANQLPLDMEVFLLGLQDAFSGSEARMTEAEMNADIKIFVDQLNERRKQQSQITVVPVNESEAETKAKAQAKANKLADGSANVAEQGAFLAAHMMQSGVTTLPNGLQLEVLRHGDGPRPKQTDSVVVKYRGTLIDGTEFDSSEPRGTATFPVSGVIAGWSEALKMMPVGSRWNVVIPPQLAYGDAGSGDKIPGKSVLIFDIELLEIVGRTD